MLMQERDTYHLVRFACSLWPCGVLVGQSQDATGDRISAGPRGRSAGLLAMVEASCIARAFSGLANVRVEGIMLVTASARARVLPFVHVGITASRRMAESLTLCARSCAAPQWHKHTSVAQTWCCAAEVLFASQHDVCDAVAPVRAGCGSFKVLASRGGHQLDGQGRLGEARADDNRNIICAEL